MKKFISILLLIAILTSVCSVGITAQALNVKYMSIDDLNIQGETRTVYFYMPDDWKNEYNYCYDETVGLDSCKPAIVWETGSYNCTDQGYDGYYLTEEVYDNIFVAEIPRDVEYFKFDNTVSVFDYDGYTPGYYVRSTDEMGVVYKS